MIAESTLFKSTCSSALALGVGQALQRVGMGVSPIFLASCELV
jgi:hypothetical protein